MSSSGTVPQTPPPARYKRSMRNYLLDTRFQLKYTSFIILVAVVISAVLVGFLWKTSGDVVRQSEQVSAQGRRAIEESKKVSDVVRMSMKDDPIYGQNPELLAAFSSTSAEADKKLEEQQAALIAQQEAIKSQQRTMLYSLCGGLALMVVLIGVLGIYFTHKVAGPIYKMKMLLRQVGEGKLSFQGRLRKGDELQDFFEAFSTMVEKLRARQAQEVEELHQAMALARADGANETAIAKIERVHAEMKAALER